MWMGFETPHPLFEFFVRAPQEEGLRNTLVKVGVTGIFPISQQRNGGTEGRVSSSQGLATPSLIHGFTLLQQWCRGLA